MEIDRDVQAIVSEAGVQDAWVPKVGTQWKVIKPIVYVDDLAQYEAEIKMDLEHNPEDTYAIDQLNRWKEKGWQKENQIILPVGTVVDIPENAYLGPNGPLCIIDGSEEMELCDWNWDLKDYVERVMPDLKGYNVYARDHILEDLNELKEDYDRLSSAESLEEFLKAYKLIGLHALSVMRAAENEEVTVEDLIGEDK